MIHKQVHCWDEAANHQLPIAAAFWIIQIVSVEECSSLMQNLMQICCSTQSVILNVMATQYICLLIGIYHSQWLVQWRHQCSCMRIPVHSPWLPGYIDVVQTVLIILTMAGLFADKPFVVPFTSEWLLLSLSFSSHSSHQSLQSSFCSEHLPSTWVTSSCATDVLLSS